MQTHVHIGTRDWKCGWVVNGDDFFCAGPDQVAKYVAAMQSFFEVKVTIIGSKEDQQKEVEGVHVRS